MTRLQKPKRSRKAAPVRVRHLERDDTIEPPRVVKPDYFRRQRELRDRRARREAVNVALRPDDTVTVDLTGELHWTVLRVSIEAKTAELSTTIFELPDRRHTAPFAEMDVIRAVSIPARHRRRKRR
jgi:hypothetical protein